MTLKGNFTASHWGLSGLSTLRSDGSQNSQAGPRERRPKIFKIKLAQGSHQARVHSDHSCDGVTSS